MATLEDGGSSMFLHLLAKPGFKKIYVLNGHTGALPHLWEYFKITNDAIAKNLFEKGTGYLKNHLPEFDCGDWSYYDRTGTVAMESYHKGQIRQLDRRYRIENPWLRDMDTRSWFTTSKSMLPQANR